MIRCLMTSQNHLLSPLLYLHILYYHIQARASWPHPCMMPLESRISCWSYHMDLGQRTDCTESAYPSLPALQCTPFAWHIFLASWKKKNVNGIIELNISGKHFQLNWNHLKFLPILLETWIGKNATVDEICENFPPRTKLALFLWASLDNATISC